MEKCCIFSLMLMLTVSRYESEFPWTFGMRRKSSDINLNNWMYNLFKVIVVNVKYLHCFKLEFFKITIEYFKWLNKIIHAAIYSTNNEFIKYYNSFHTSKNSIRHQIGYNIFEEQLTKAAFYHRFAIGLQSKLI